MSTQECCLPSFVMETGEELRSWRKAIVAPIFRKGQYRELQTHQTHFALWEKHGGSPPETLFSTDGEGH